MVAMSARARRGPTVCTKEKRRRVRASAATNHTRVCVVHDARWMIDAVTLDDDRSTRLERVTRDEEERAVRCGAVRWMRVAVTRGDEKDGDDATVSVGNDIENEEEVTTVASSAASTFIDAFNAEYLTKHKTYEDEFWATKMNLEGNSTEALTRSFNALESSHGGRGVGKRGGCWNRTRRRARSEWCWNRLKRR